MIVGIPNVGKSSLINRMAQKKLLEPATSPPSQKEQWVRLSPKLHLLDTPGMLWHKFEDQEIGKALAACGCIKEAILNPVEIATFIVEILDDRYPEAINKRFKLQDMDRTEIVERIGQSGDASFLAVGSISPRPLELSAESFVEGSLAESRWRHRID